MKPSRRLGTSPSRAFSRSPRALLIAVGLIALAWLLGAGIEILRVRNDVEGGRRALTSLSVDRLGDGLVPTVRSAASRLSHADDVADGSPFLAPLRALPVLGDQVDALRDLTEAADELGRNGVQAAERIDVQLEAAKSEPAARISMLDTVLEELDRLEDAVAEIDLPSGGGLIPPLADARRSLQRELDAVPDRFEKARQHVAAVRGLLAGPSRYLVLAANNAEMRGGAGMPLSAGVLTISNGDFQFGDFEATANRHVPGVHIPAPYRQTYQQFKVGRSWLQTAVSPNFTTTGPIYEAMSAQFTTGPVDGVIEVDVVALKLLLEAIGPVDHEGVRYDATNVEQLLLNEAYLQTTANIDDVVERRDQQGAIAKAIFDALKTRDVEIGELAGALRTAASGRHLLAHSGNEDVQELWDSLGATGELPIAGLMVTVQNISASKLDWYIDPVVTLATAQEKDTGAWVVRLTVNVPNPIRERTSLGVESAIQGFKPGWHRVLVGTFLPEAAYDIRSLDLDFSEKGFDPPLQMVGKRTYIEPGDTASMSIEFKLPASHFGVMVLPAGRVRPTVYRVDGTRYDDAVPTPVVFLRPDPEEGLPPAPVLAALLALAGAWVQSAGVIARGRARVKRMAPGELAIRAVPFGAVLYGAALMVWLTGALITATS